MEGRANSKFKRKIFMKRETGNVMGRTSNVQQPIGDGVEGRESGLVVPGRPWSPLVEGKKHGGRVGGRGGNKGAEL